MLQTQYWSGGVVEQKCSNKNVHSKYKRFVKTYLAIKKATIILHNAMITMFKRKNTQFTAAHKQERSTANIILQQCYTSARNKYLLHIIVETLWANAHHLFCTPSSLLHTTARKYNFYKQITLSVAQHIIIFQSLFYRIYIMFSKFFFYLPRVNFNKSVESVQQQILQMEQV